MTASAELARGSLVRLRKDMVRMPDGDVVGRDVLEHPGAVAVLALDDDERVLMIRQYRHPVGRLLWEIPAGLRDVAGEPLHATARARAARGDRVPGGAVAGAGRLLLVAGDQHRADPDLPRPRPGRGPRGRAARTCPSTRRPTWCWPGCRWTQAVVRILAGDLHNGVTALGILSAYAARQDGFAALRDADAPER